jgi:hypothetical protein
MHLKQIRLDSHEEVKDYGDIYDGYHNSCLQTTSDSKWLFDGRFDYNVMRISVENREVDKEFSQPSMDTLNSMKITPDDEKMFVGSVDNLYLISLIDGEVLKKFRNVHGYDLVTGIVITADQKFFFTSSYEGILKQWNYGDNTLVRDHGRIASRICSLCL